MPAGGQPTAETIRVGRHQVRVLQVIQQGQFRGAEVFALDLGGELARGESWDVSLLSLSRVNPAYGAAAASAGLPVMVAQGNGRVGGLDLRLVWRLKSIIDAGRYQIVQANGAGTLKYVVAARQLARRPWRVVYRAIGIGSYWRRGARRFAYVWLLARADLVIAVCRAVAGDLSRSSGVDPRRIVVVPNGVSLSRISASREDRESTRTALGIGPDEPLIIYAGSFSPEKNLGALLNVVATCRARGISAKALLLGEGPARETLAEMVRRHRLEAAVHFLPPQERVGIYLAAADLCVLPSFSEGMPAVLIEAGLMAVPAVAYAVGGVPEVIEDGVTGLLVRAGDETAMNRAVAMLLGDSTRRRQMGLAALDRYTRFTMPTIARAYRNAYETLLEEACPL